MIFESETKGTLILTTSYNKFLSSCGECKAFKGSVLCMKLKKLSSDREKMCGIFYHWEKVSEIKKGPKRILKTE
jgi:hypothetical protein